MGMGREDLGDQEITEEISCYRAIMQVEIKTVGSSGQISLGKQYAGRTVMVEQVSKGVWTIKTAQVIPDNEAWLHTPAAKASLDRALEWSDSHARAETDMASLERKVLVKKASRRK
jgi:putative transposon-encoded protein